MRYIPCPFGAKKRDLSKHKFTHEEKTWFVWKCQQDKNQAQKMAKKYSLKVTRLRQWVTRAKKGNYLHAQIGRPRAYGLRQIKTIRIKLSGNSIQKNMREYDIIMTDGSKDRAKELGKDPKKAVKPSPRTLKRIEKLLNIEDQNAEKTTWARFVACHDVRNFVSYAAVSTAASDGVPDYLTGNIDSTVFPVGHQFKEKVKVKSIGKIEGCVKALPNSEGNEENAVGIKVYLAITANGRAGRPVYIVSQTGLPVGKDDWYKIPALGLGVGETTAGYVVFSHSKETTIEFLQNYHENVLFPLFKSAREENEDSDGRAWLQVDGETRHIQYYENYGVLESLKANNITVTKSPASTTEVLQPCDNGGCFKGPKTVLKGLKLEATQINEKLVKKLKDIMEKQSEKGSFTHAYIDSVSKGLVKVHHCLKTIRPETIMKSFNNCGLFPLSIEKILQNCRGLKELTDHERDNVFNSIPNLTRKVRMNGELTERDMTREGIPVNVQYSHKLSKDELVNYRRRAILLTHDRYIDKEQMKKNDKGLKEAMKELKNQQQDAAPEPPAENTTGKRKRKVNKQTDFEY